ncbi:MAG: hypothetical protein GF328_13110 [Candidatus Latescibacteria bacterium]|nr:hypothetical protein [Candidatus Latescibacterota bacterium]
MSPGELMARAGALQQQFQMLTEQATWMQGDSLVAGSEHTRDLAYQLVMMSRGVRQAILDVQMLQHLGGSEASGQVSGDDLARMHRHLEAMAEQLGGMKRILSRIPPGAMADE